MGRFLTLCILVAMAGIVTDGRAGGGHDDRVRKLQPGIDTLPPQFVRTEQACGVWNYVATEVRNLPDPPNAIPRETDQIDRGIASVGFMDLPAPVNVRLVLVTDQSFPSAPSYKSFTFSISLVDPSKEGRAILVVRDFANNLRIDTVNIRPAAPAVSSARVDYGIVRAGTRERRTVAVRNTSAQPMVITDMRVRGNGPFAIANPPALPYTIPPSGTFDVQLDYAPVRGTTAEDHAALVVESQCGNTTSEIRGVVGLALLDVEDWAVGDVRADERVCKPDGLRIVNNGNMPVTITGFDIGNPSVTLSTPTVPPLPIEVLPGAEIHVQDLCYGRTTVGKDTASVRVQSDAQGDDLTCVVTGRVVTSIDEHSDVIAPWVRYVAASETLDVTCDDGRARIVVVDVRGRLLHTTPITPPLTQVDARTFPGGTVIVTIDSARGRRTVAVPILR